MLQEAAERGEVGGHDREPAGQRLQHGQPEPLVDGRESEKVSGPVEALELGRRQRAHAPHP